jgi:hypothetical protein
MSLLNEGGAATTTTTEPVTTAGATTTTEPVTTATPAATVGPDWSQMYKSLPEELRNDNSLSTITSFEGLAKSFVHAQKTIGRDKIAIPDKHATKEDWQSVFTKLGNPSDIKDYKLDLPEGSNEEMIGKLKAVAHANGIMPWQFKEILTSFDGALKERSATELQQTELTQKESLDSLRTEFGDSFDKQVQKANVAFKELLPNDTDRQAAIEQGLGNNPLMIKILANAAKTMSEDQFLGQGAGNLTSVTPKEAESKARMIMGDASHPYRNKSHPSHMAAQKEVKDLWALAYPE